MIGLRLRRRSRKAAHGSSADRDSLRDAEQALDAAEYLVAQRKPTDAVRLLTEANRRRRTHGSRNVLSTFVRCVHGDRVGTRAS